MCSSIVHTIFNLVLTASIIILAVSVATPEWQKLEAQSKAGSKSDVDRGLFYWKCLEKIEDCSKNVWENMEAFERAVAIMLLIAICVGIITLLYSCCLCLAFCCKSCFVWLIPVLCFIALCINVIAIIVYVAKKGDIVDAFNVKTLKAHFGYSLYLACVGAVGYAISFCLGLVLVCTTKVSPV